MFFEFVLQSHLGLDQTGYLSLPTCITEPWVLMTVTSLYWFSFYKPLVVDINHGIPGTRHNHWCYKDPLAQLSSHHI